LATLQFLIDNDAQVESGAWRFRKKAVCKNFTRKMKANY